MTVYDSLPDVMDPSHRQVIASLPATPPLYELKAELFKAIAHPIRIRILELVSASDEVSVAQMLNKIPVESSHLSQHLSVLRRHRVVRSTRRGSHVFYSMGSVHGQTLLQVAALLLADLRRAEDEQWLADRESVR